METDMDMGMTIAERAGIALKWSYASLATSVITFLITAFYIYKYRSTKAAFIAGSASISALSLIISNAMLIASILNIAFSLSVQSMLIGFQYSFAFHTIFYAFHRIIKNAKKSNKIVVYVGYIWMVVTIAIAIAVLALMNKENFFYSDQSYIFLYDMLSLLSYSIWGFIAVALLLYFVNKNYFSRKTGYTILSFIGLNLISAVVAIIIAFTVENNIQLANGILFFFVDVPTKISLVIAAYYGYTWIQDNSNGNCIVNMTESGDLEAN
jgi:hypothetical protein